MAQLYQSDPITITQMHWKDKVINNELSLFLQRMFALKALGKLPIDQDYHPDENVAEWYARITGRSVFRWFWIDLVREFTPYLIVMFIHLLIIGVILSAH